MIAAELHQLRAQSAWAPNMAKALDFLIQMKAAELIDGRVDIDGDVVFAIVQSYDTSTLGDPITLEVHKRYIDVQYVADGEEVVAWAPAHRLPVSIEYDEAKEAWFGVIPAAEASFVRLAAGEAGVFYPTDGHAPRLAAGTPGPVKKIVIKVAVES